MARFPIISPVSAPASLSPSHDHSLIAQTKEKVELQGNEKPVQATTTTSGKTKKRKIRNAGRSNTQPKAPKRQQLSIEEATARARTRERAELQSQAFFSSNGSHVTPSPKPGDSTAASLFRGGVPTQASVTSQFFSPQPPQQQAPFHVGPGGQSSFPPSNASQFGAMDPHQGSANEAPRT